LSGIVFGGIHSGNLCYAKLNSKYRYPAQWFRRLVDTKE